MHSVVYYESIKRELNKRLIFDSRCDARLKAKVEGCTRLAYTIWHEEDEVNKRAVCECDGWVCDLDATGAPSTFRVILSSAALARMLPTLALNCEEDATRLYWYRTLVDYISWTPEAAKKRSVSRWACKNRRRTNSLCNVPDVLAIIGIKATKFVDSTKGLFMMNRESES